MTPRHRRRRPALAPLILAALASACAPVAAAAAAARRCGPVAGWAHWNRYVAHFVSADGRVVDRGTGARTTSEGQAYALFFALVANDRALFEALLSWTRDNLSQGDLAAHLPAWKWGRSARGRWEVLDSNSASDADLWLAYALVEAGRLWSEPRYRKLGHAVLANAARSEIADLPGLGPTLLPAPRGFEIERGAAWRLNPSYAPPQLLRRFAALDPGGPWAAVLRSSAQVVLKTARHGFAPDWVVYRAGEGFADDPVTGPIGSYDAIRVYLWAGMLPDADPLRPAQAAATAGMLRALRQGAVPEAVDLRSGTPGPGEGPVGFAAALLPQARRDPGLRRALEARLARAAGRGGLYGEPPAYYDQNLILFARAWVDGRFSFGADGRLLPRWEGTSCH